MENQIFVDWGESKVKLKWESKKSISQNEIVTSVHCYCFYKGKILLVHVKKRGFTCPGGHIEIGETPEDTIHREVYEEGYVKGKIYYLGAIQVSHEDNPNFSEKGKYPLIGYQLFYKMDIEECLPFLREYETLSRIWIEPEEFPYVVKDHDLTLLILKEALRIPCLD